MTLRLVTAPATEPVTLAETKLHCRAPASTTEDSLITNLIVATRQACEQELKRALITQSWEVALPVFPDVIVLPNPPLVSVTSIIYKDASNVQQTLSSSLYTVDDRAEPAQVVPLYGTSWPSTYPIPNAVKTTYSCGYGAAATVPQAIKQWILTMVEYYFRNRGAVVVVEGSATVTPLPYIGGLLDPYRIWTL